MEQIINIHIEKLPEGVYLATSNDVPGLGGPRPDSDRDYGDCS